MRIAVSRLRLRQDLTNATEPEKVVPTMAWEAVVPEVSKALQRFDVCSATLLP
jgi:hypothetical protein